MTAYIVRTIDWTAPYLFGYSIAALTFTGNWWWAAAWPVCLIILPIVAEGIRLSRFGRRAGLSK